ncbi:MAG: hypothetical protein ACREV6_22495 [Clostridium sp.]
MLFHGIKWYNPSISCFVVVEYCNFNNSGSYLFIDIEKEGVNYNERFYE